MLAFESLRSIVRDCTGMSCPSFYRSLYGMRPGDAPLDVRTPEEWQRLPFVTKDALIATPLRTRSFIPLGTIDHLRPSSGTSGKVPLFSPRTPLREMDYRRKYHSFTKPCLAYTVPAMPHWHESFMERTDAPGLTVTFDPKRAEASVRLARIAGVDSISVFAFHIPLIAGHMKRERMNRDIRFIEICGEACTQLLFQYMRETFPNATILPFYGSSEVEDSPIGMPCRPITGVEPLAVYHAKPSHYHEIIDPETLEPIMPAAGAEGELVITAFPGKPTAFPLIRYRTGDTVRVIDAHCKKHGTWSFTVLGRTAMDFLKLPGGILRADEIERVLRTMPDLVSDKFELHWRERQSPLGPQFEPTLHIESTGATALHDLAETIARQLRVAPSFTYTDGVREGRYLPMTCRPLNVTPGAKSKRIVRDE